MAARDRGKLWRKGERKSMAARDRGKIWLKKTTTMAVTDRGKTMKNMAARYRGKKVDARAREKSNGCRRKLLLQETEKTMGCKEQRKTMAENNRGKVW
jgi:hypothetical protein